jgi:TRAP-type C4-dicarboxylate transport system permease small subunit
MRATLAWLKRGADYVAVGLLTAMFLSFLLQIFSRYVLVSPLGWTLEACLVTWLWLVFWSCAFIVRERDHVTFNLFYVAMPAPLRRVLALLASAALVAAFLVSLPATVDYVAFMKIESTSLLRIRFDFLFAIYPIFLVAVVVQGITRIARLLSPVWRDETDEPGENVT